MIGSILSFLRNHLNASLGVDEFDLQEQPLVRFVDGDKMEPITFSLNGITLLLINVEEERVLRTPDRHTRVRPDGVQQRIQPDIQLNLHLLFVARFKQYEQAWASLSKVIAHFQTNRIITAATHPELPAGIERLVFELRTLDFAEQNEVWNALRTTHHPSILYKARAVTFLDQQPHQPPELVERDTNIGGRD